jgi:hypothetical protein
MILTYFGVLYWNYPVNTDHSSKTTLFEKLIRPENLILILT